MKPCIIIGITGGSGSGKTMFLNQLLQTLPPGASSVLSLDNYYKTIDLQPKDAAGVENFDLPESLDLQRFCADLRRLQSGEDITITEYTFNNDARLAKTIEIKATPIIMVEGIFTFYYKEVREMLDLKVFVEAPEYLMLTRRIVRDAEERGYDLSDVLYRFQHHVTPSFKKYIEPLKYEADLIVPNHHKFDAALEVVASFLQQKLD